MSYRSLSPATGEVEFSRKILTYYAKNGERFLVPVALHPVIGQAHTENSPIGGLFAVEPWTFPYYQFARRAGPHLMAGNVLMFKPAGNVPQCAIGFEQLWTQAGAPAGFYANLRISSAEAPAFAAVARTSPKSLEILGE